MGENGRVIERRKENSREGKEIWKVAFWNVAGIRNKDPDFWKEIRGWDIVLLMETWTDKKGWEKISTHLPKGYRWEAQVAKRKNKKGRACGGMLLGVREGIEEERISGGCSKEGIMECKNR